MAPNGVRFHAQSLPVWNKSQILINVIQFFFGEAHIQNEPLPPPPPSHSQCFRSGFLKKGTAACESVPEFVLRVMTVSGSVASSFFVRTIACQQPKMDTAPARSVVGRPVAEVGIHMEEHLGAVDCRGQCRALTNICPLISSNC